MAGPDDRLWPQDAEGSHIGSFARLLLVLMLTVAATAGCSLCGRGSAAAPPANQPVALLNAEHRKSLVRECVIGIAADVDAIKLRHAELAGWSAAAADADGGRIGYQHRVKYWAKREDDGIAELEPGGCLVLVEIAKPELRQLQPKHRLTNLELDVYVFVQGGKDLVDAVNGIVDKRLAPLVELNRSRGRPLPVPEDRPGGNRPEPE